MTQPLKRCIHSTIWEVIHFKFHPNRSTGFRNAETESCPVPSTWSSAYTPVCRRKVRFTCIPQKAACVISHTEVSYRYDDCCVRFGGDATRSGNGAEDPRFAARESPAQCAADEAADAQQMEARLSQSQPQQRGLPLRSAFSCWFCALCFGVLLDWKYCCFCATHL